MGDVYTVFGFFLGFLGFLITIATLLDLRQINETARAETRREINEAVQSVALALLSGETWSLLRLISEIRTATRAGQWETAFVLCQEARLASSQSLGNPLLLDAERQVIRDAGLDLRLVLRYYPGLKVAHSCHESSSFRPPEVAVMAILLPDARELSDDVLEALRLRALRGCELGLTEVQVAGLLGVARETVCRWWAAYAGHGVPALPRCRSGRPLGSGRALSDAQAEHLQQLVRTHQPEELGIAAPLWTRRAVRDLIRKEFDLDLAERTVGRYLKLLGLHGQAAAPSRP